MNNMSEELTLGQWLVMCLYVKFRNEGVAEETINERVRKAFLDITQQWASLILTCGYGYINPSICGDKIKQEDNMSENKKPRLAEALGVEVGEKFKIKGYFDGEYSFDDVVLFRLLKNGTYETTPPRYKGSAVALLQAIEHPERIIHMPRWTEREVEDAKNIIRLFGTEDFTYAMKDENGYPGLSDTDNFFTMGTIGLENNIFPSLKPGEFVKLTDIIGGNK